jgi:competence protein ComEC
MIEFLTLVLLGGATLYHSVGVGLLGIGIISALTSAFFFMYFLSRKGLVFGLLIGCSLLLGALTVWSHTSLVSKEFFSDRIILGQVQSVDRRLDKTLLVVKDQTFNHLVQVTLHSTTTALPGDIVKVFGTIQQPQDFITSSGRLFPYQSYLQSKNIIGIVPLASISIVSNGNFSLARFATTMRFQIADIFTRYVSFPTDGLLAGVVVGYAGGIPQTIQDLFRTTGVLHVLVLSGENITLLAIFLSIVLRPVPFRIRSFLTGGAMILVVLISGAGVSAVRAGIMGTIALSAGLIRRNYVPLRALTFSILFFFFISPETIFADPGFHLSVLATIFMIVVLPKTEVLFQWVPEKYSIRELIILALCVPLFMLPYTMYFSGLVPLASPFANILMALVTQIMMLCGATVLAVSWLFPVARLIGMLVSWLGSIVIKILEMLNTLPQLNTPPLAWWSVIAIYILFFAIVFRLELKQFWYDIKIQQRSIFLPHSNSSETESH